MSLNHTNSLVPAWPSLSSINLNFYSNLQKEVNVSNVVKIAQELNNLSAVDQGSTLNAGDIENIATILENIAAVKEKANEVGIWFLT